MSDFRPFHRLWLALSLPFLSWGCTPPAAVVPAQPTGAPPATASDGPWIHALPGALDAVPVFNSNSPELVRAPGVTLSTLPAGAVAPGEAFLDYAFSGRFSVFSHHVAEAEPGNPSVLHLGLLAHNRGTRPVQLRMFDSASYLTRPDAPFTALAALLPDPAGTVFAGPGDRLATALLHGAGNLPDATIALAPGETRLVFSGAVPTRHGLFARNARSSLLRFESDGDLYLSEAAVFAAESVSPDRAAFEAVLAVGQLAGPRDATPTVYDPASPPTGGSFRYGRVAGVSGGDTWRGTLFDDAEAPKLPAPGGRVGFPISTVVLNHVGTRQIQAAPMLRRYADTALQSHGNYGVTYRLTVPFDNSEDVAQRYTLALSSPLKVEAGSLPAATYLPPATRRVTFRGPVRLAWRDADGTQQTRHVHVVLHDGEELPPFETLTVPANSRLEVTLTLIYPADCTPPQLLTVGRL